jgi:hypothetical protein
MIRLLEGDPLLSFGDLGISFPIRLTAHRQVHTHLGALAHEVGLEPFHDSLVYPLNISPLHFILEILNMILH